MKELFGILLFYFFRLFPINNNKIVISSYLGKGYGDNAKYIVNELLKEDRLDIVWLVRGNNTTFPKKIRIVKYGSLASFYEMVTARIWIDNRRKPGYVRKRKGQYYINTWHASISLKKVEKDAGESLSKNYINAAKKDSKMCDLFLSGGDWETNLYQRAFWYSGEILKCGYPRQDILFNNDLCLWKQIKKKLEIAEETKILLYAPTFRKGFQDSSINNDVYSLAWNRVLDSMKNRFGGSWIGLIRLHPNIASLSFQLNLPESVIDVSNYDDMQELMLVSDCMITDYSSSIMEFGLQGRPGFLFAVDMENYIKDRNTYFDLNQLPFPLGTDNDSLIMNITKFDAEKYEADLKSFYKNCGVYEGGKASTTVAKVVLNKTAQGIGK